jgi:tRNA(Ile)-lysidine synthase
VAVRSPAEAFLQRVRKTIARHRMLAPGDRVLVAVSGGPDSVALLGALSRLAPRYRLDLWAAHLNHQLRGDESLRDQHTTEAVAASLGVPVTVECVREPLAGSGVEARARDLRYAFLARVAEQQGCMRIATGHTRDDQAETVIMRLLRGAGRDGLAGIPAVREGRYIRPLLECSRHEILAFLEANRLRYCEDSSNTSRDFLRNRIRHDIMPLLSEINPRVSSALASAATVMAEEGAYLEGCARSILAAAMLPDGSLSVTDLLAAPPGLRQRVARAWLRQARGNLRQLGAAHFSATLDVALGPRPNARVLLPGGGEIIREYGQLRFAELNAVEEADGPAKLSPGTEVRLASGWRIAADVIGRGSEGSLPNDLCTLLADAAHLPAALTVRRARPGDRIRPHGLGGHRKLQDVFVDRKVAVSIRRSCPVVEAEGEIVWVPGVVRSDLALVTPQTLVFLRLSARKTGIAAL